jgi:hypothetical protein
VQYIVEQMNTPEGQKLFDEVMAENWANTSGDNIDDQEVLELHQPKLPILSDSIQACSYKNAE